MADRKLRLPLPLKVDEGNDIVGNHGHLLDRDEGLIVAQIVNDHDRLTAELDAAKAEIAKLNQILNATDGLIAFGRASVESNGDGTWTASNGFRWLWDARKGVCQTFKSFLFAVEALGKDADGATWVHEALAGKEN